MSDLTKTALSVAQRIADEGFIEQSDVNNVAAIIERETRCGDLLQICKDLINATLPGRNAKEIGETRMVARALLTELDAAD